MRKTWTDRAGRLIRYLGCVYTNHYKGRCANPGIVRVDAVETALQEALGKYFSNVKLMEQHHERFLAALNAAQKQQSTAVLQAKRDLADAEIELGNIRKAILKGLVGDLTADMLKDVEAKRTAAADALRLAQEMHAAQPMRLPPSEILKGLTAKRIEDRRDTYRRLLAKVTLKSARPKGKRKVTAWTLEITPRPEAGLTGVPLKVIVRCSPEVIREPNKGTCGPNRPAGRADLWISPLVVSEPSLDKCEGLG